MKRQKDYEFTGYNKSLIDNARLLRKAMTKQEKRLWYDHLRGYPVKWYRQRAIDGYIVDFYCHKAHLVIEVDGIQHYTEEGMEYDTVRTEILEQYGLCVLRFSNSEIDRNFESVCLEIDEMVRELIGDLRKQEP